MIHVAIAITLCLGLKIPSNFSATVSQLNQLAENRDVNGVEKFLDNESKNLSIAKLLETNGAYGCGSKGWHAAPLIDSTTGSKYVVFWTPLMCEDIGNLLFKETKEGLHYVPEDERFNARIVKHDFTIHVAPEKKYVQISDKCTVDKSGSSLTMMRLNTEFIVSNITENKNQVEFDQAKGVILFHLKPGVHNLEIKYAGIVNTPGYGGSISDNLALLMGEYWYPMIARWPAPYSERVYVPKDWTVVGQGELQGHKIVGEEGIWQFNMKMPISIYSLDMGKFHSATYHAFGLTFNAYSNSQSSEYLKYVAETYAPVVEFYSKTFSKYPFSHYGVVGARAVGDDALEAYSFASYGYLGGEDSHEPSHTWWGGFIPNTYLHSLWNESFADFSEELYSQNVPIGNVHDRKFAFYTHPNVVDIPNEPTIEKGGAFVGPVASYLGYSKGSYVLMQLEEQIGKEKMVDCMRSWLKVHNPERPGEWPDFEKIVNNVTGQNMKWFFDQWLRRPGFPHLNLSLTSRNKHFAQFSAKFTGSPYRLKIPYLVVSSTGNEVFGYEDIPAQTTSTFKMPINSDAKLISFDPYRILLRKIHRDEEPLSINLFNRNAEPIRFGNAEPTFRSINDMEPVQDLPTDLNGKAIFVGLDKINDPKVMGLIEKSGIRVENAKASYHGQTVDLSHGGVEFLVNLPGGGHGEIVLGSSHFYPNIGDARIALFDNLGRFVAGATDPKTSGFWVFKI